MQHTVVVTGGCGFIGGHFLRLLRAAHPDWRVVNLDKLTYAGNLDNLTDFSESGHYRFVHGDIADADLIARLVREEQPWGIVNFAAESHVDRSILDPSPFLHTNVVGVHVLLDVVRRGAVERFVQISTDEVYGDVQTRRPPDEEAALRPSSPYAASKGAADLLALSYHRTYGVPILIARSANNYGPHQFPEKLIPLMIRNALAGEILPVYGDGAQVRDWLYVADNCAAILQVLEHGRLGAIYNVEAGEHRPNIEVVRAICHLVAEEAHLDVQTMLDRIQFVPDRPGHDRRYVMESGRIRTELGWTPATRFQDGLRTTIRWYLEHQEWTQRVTSGDYRAYYEAVYRRNWGSQG
jgi:dTDP-glucose 4,6-dehydratase